MLELGADVNQRYIDVEQKGMTLLHLACLRGKIEQVKLLLRYGADFNTKCWRGRTTLDFVKINTDDKSDRKKEALKALLYKYTIK